MTRAATAFLLMILPFAAFGGDVRPGRDYLTPELQQLQDDPSRHPGFLWVQQGAEIWREAPASGRQSCAGCHGSAEQSMRGVATRYPAVDPASGKLLNVEGRINQCRTDRQDAPPFPYESEALLGLASYIGLQSRGLPVSVRIDGAAAGHFERGRAFFEMRQGQFDLSCRQCHQDRAGQRLSGETMSHGLGNGYPVYRLEWNGVGSLHRRFRSCAAGVRAEPYPSGAPEYVALELYLAWRARGLPMETPAIRR